MNAHGTQKESRSRPVVMMYALGFLVGIHIALPAYLYSSFLSQFFPEKFIGVIFAVGSLVTIWAFSKLPKLLRRFGNFQVATLVLSLAIVTTAAFAVLDIPLLVIGVFTLNTVSLAALGFNMDIFLEHSSADNITGKIRGIYLVCINGAWIVAQLINSFILSDGRYTSAFLLSAFAALPVLFLIRRNFKKFQDPAYQNLHTFKLFRTATKNKNLIGIYLINFLLQFFYAWMVIYTPLYLHGHIGFSWQQIALMFSVMLLPFALLQAPLGTVADRWLGEKEMLVAGFLIMAVSVFAMTFAAAQSLLFWTALLFVSRIGAATVEVMSETYFFKHVTDKDVSLIGLFRTTRPWAYIVSSILATVLLPFMAIQYLFAILACIMLYGAFRSLLLKDTL